VRRQVRQKTKNTHTGENSGIKREKEGKGEMTVFPLLWRAVAKQSSLGIEASFNNTI